LADMGFEIGNHTWHHRNIDSISNKKFESELYYIERKCDTFGIQKPTTFAYSAYRVDSTKWPILMAHGYFTARAGGDLPWQVDMITDY
jgi:peptidoglycan-N-acetylglucosamine deacetylase